MPESSYTFILLGTGVFLCYSISYPIVIHVPAFVHSFLLIVTVVKGIGPKLHTYLSFLVLEFSCVILIHYKYGAFEQFAFEILPCIEKPCDQKLSQAPSMLSKTRLHSMRQLLQNGSSSRVHFIW